MVARLSSRVPIVEADGSASAFMQRQFADLAAQVANGGTALPDQTGNAGKVLQTDGSALSWASVGGTGTVTNVATSGTVNGITLTGGPITTTGTVTLGGTLSGVDLATQTTGTLAIARGGTGATTATAGLDALAGVTSTAFGRARLADADAAAARAAIGAGTGSGDVVGPVSATDNAIARYDLATGKLIQNSAATVSDDGIIRSATNSGANAVAVPLSNWVMLTANYTLTSSIVEQRLFNTTANGRLTLPTGVYYFDCWIYLLSMSGTIGNLAFDPIGAGTVVTDRWGQTAVGIDSTVSPLGTNNMTGSASVTQQTPVSMVTATTGTAMQARASGMFRISTGGTIIPSVTLVTAAAAIVQAGSWFKIDKIGESSETFVGAWT